ncbi:YcaO-like family protein [Phaeobacter sp. CECT 5382]|uniref:YcaO-like family protein n=1 Tax=Phaeobacter sp. CECT 5382 TaxID=1712645 RepID=UPI0009E6C377|nr:YcaO-like family protein [Phaeobacter sp. CECT 5382]
MTQEAMTQADDTPKFVRKDWRRLPFSPGLCCLQALSPSGKSASGAALTRADAYFACMGELAEIAALEHANPEAEPAPHPKPDLAAKPSWTGLAAGQSDAAAQYRALCEALERASIDLWWQGHLRAAPVDMTQSQGPALQGLIDRLRGSKTSPRRSSLWRLDGFGGLPVTVALSTDAQSKGLVLGYGADWDAAASGRRALVEMALMELNLSDTTDPVTQAKRLSALQQGFEARINRLFSTAPKAVDGRPLAPLSTAPTATSGSAQMQRNFEALKTALKAASVGYRIRNLSAPDLAYPVWTVTLTETPSAGSPTPLCQRPLL